MLSCFILGGRGGAFGNVSVENNTNHLLFHNAMGLLSWIMVEVAIQPRLKNTHSAAQ